MSKAIQRDYINMHFLYHISALFLCENLYAFKIYVKEYLPFSGDFSAIIFLSCEKWDTTDFML